MAGSHPRRLNFSEDDVIILRSRHQFPRILAGAQCGRSCAQCRLAAAVTRVFLLTAGTSASASHISGVSSFGDVPVRAFAHFLWVFIYWLV